jgi:hypothetical protein
MRSKILTWKEKLRIMENYKRQRRKIKNNKKENGRFG